MAQKGQTHNINKVYVPGIIFYAVTHPYVVPRFTAFINWIYNQYTNGLSILILLLLLLKLSISYYKVNRQSSKETERLRRF